MDSIFQANIDHYKQLLATETDARKIAMIRRLLEEEERKLTDHLSQKVRRKPVE